MIVRIIFLNILCLIIFSSTCASEGVSFNQAQLLRGAYINFFKRLDTVQAKEPYSLEKKQTYIELREFLNGFHIIDNAYGANGDLCFFGGWPSIEEGGICKRPWVKQSHPKVQKLGQAYTSKMKCNSSSQFRCNPTLFGSPKDQDGKGYCVEMNNTFVELTQKCEKAARENLTEMASEIANGSSVGKSHEENLKKYEKLIFGEDKDITMDKSDTGFCDTFRTKSGELYDACDDLHKRINEINNKASDLKKTQIPAKKKDSYLNAQEALNACQEFLVENSSDDVYGRNIVEFFQDGLSTCRPKPQESFSEKDLDKINAHMEKNSYLSKLNKNALERNIEALLVMDMAYQGNQIKSKDELINELIKRLSSLNEAQNKEELREIIEKTFDKVNSVKSQIPQISSKNVKDKFRALSNIVNQSCLEIYDEYQDKFKDRIRGPYTEWARPFTKKEETYLNAKREKIKKQILDTFSKSDISFLMGTDSFIEKVMDPSFDHAKECAQNSPYQVINDFSDKTYEKALVEAKSELLKSFSDFNDDKMITKNLSNDDFSDTIKDYLKTDQALILQTIREEKDPNKQKELVTYLCSEIKDIYDSDEWLQGFGIIGGGASALVGGIMAIGGGFLCPVTGIGCAISYAGTAMSYTGTAVLGTAAGIKGYEGISEKDQNNKVQLTNLVSEYDSSSKFLDKSQKVDKRITDAVYDGGAIAAGFGIASSIRLVTKRLRSPNEVMSGTGREVVLHKPQNSSRPSSNVIDGEAIVINPKSSGPVATSSAGSLSVKSKDVALKNTEIVEQYDKVYKTYRDITPYYSSQAPKLEKGITIEGEFTVLSRESVKTPKNLPPNNPLFLPAPKEGSSLNNILLTKVPKDTPKKELGFLNRVEAPSNFRVSHLLKDKKHLPTTVISRSVSNTNKRGNPPHSDEIKASYSVVDRQGKFIAKRSPVSYPIHEVKGTKKLIKEKDIRILRTLSGFKFLPSEVFLSNDTKLTILDNLNISENPSSVNNLIKTLQQDLLVLENLKDNTSVNKELLGIEILKLKSVIKKLEN